MPYIRSDQARISVTIAGKTYGDSWFSVEGGNLEADDTKTRPGGMGYEVSLGGPVSREDVTVATQLTDTVIGWHSQLESLVRRCATTKVAYTFLDCDRAPVGPSFVVTGTLKGARLPDMDTDSSDVAMYEIIVSCDELAASGAGSPTPISTTT